VARKKAEPRAARLRITQVRSGIGRPGVHKRTLRALGLRRHQQSVVQQDSPALRGMLFHVRHLVEVQELAEGEE
jgi:large subunit ribosomal protein L30